MSHQNEGQRGHPTASVTERENDGRGDTAAAESAGPHSPQRISKGKKGKLPHQRKHLKHGAPLTAAPPTYPKEPHEMTYHGDTRVDNYSWLANRKDPRVKQYIEKENAALEHFFAESQPNFFPSSPSPQEESSRNGTGPSIRRQLFREMKRRWREDDVSLPTLDRSFWYYVRNVKNAEYPLFCRRPYNKAAGVNVNFLEDMCDVWRKDPSAVMPAFEDEVIFLDLNLLVQELKLSFAEIGEMDISPDEKQLAVTLDCSDGKEVFTLFIMPIVNVNYAHWLEYDSDALHRAWAKELEQTHQSVYSPLTPASSLSVGSPASFSGSPARSGGGGFPRHAVTKGKSKSKPPAKGAAPEGTKERDGPRTETSTKTDEDRDSQCFPTRPGAPPPRHVIRTTIDIFDLAGEVLWVSPTAVMYIAVDDKMRKYQVIYHDLEIPDASDASFIVFEEADEAFWVGSLCFTADDAFVVFCTSSTEVSEWYAVPVSQPARARLERANDKGEAAVSLGATGGGALPFPTLPPGTLPALAFEDRACENRTLTDIPFAQDARVKEEFEQKAISTHADGTRRRIAPVLQFSQREECPVEYDLDHHRALLGPEESASTETALGTTDVYDGGHCRGAWLMVGNPKPCTNFAIFILPDSWHTGPSADLTAEENKSDDVVNGHPSRARVLSLAATLSAGASFTEHWQPLFAYDENIKVDGVESFYHFLLVCVRRNGRTTTLFCPIERVWRWWAEGQQLGGSGGLRTPMNLLIDAFDLSALLTVFPCLRGGKEGEQREEENHESWHALVDTNAAGSVRVTPLHRTADTCESKETTKTPCLPEALHAMANGVVATPLECSVECYAGCTSFYSCTWRMSVAHLLHPGVQLQCTFHPEALARLLAMREDTIAAAAAAAADTALGMLDVVRLREEVVNGPREYLARDYEGAVIWVPSDHYATSVSGRTTSGSSAWIRTKEPSPVVQIPVTMCWRRDCYEPGANAVVVHVYGAYGDADDPEFSTERLSLLDRGVCWAFAAVRGGGELGIPWRDAGRKGQRGTTINDYLSVASFLQDNELCRRGRLVACGGSAGGVPVCRAMERAPELFFGVVGSAPFVDCLTALLDDDMPLSVTEREEFGDPVGDKEAYHLIKSLSPTDNVDELANKVSEFLSGPEQVSPELARLRLPHVLLVTSWEDTRVGYWESMKLAAALRAEVYKPFLDHLMRQSQDHGSATEQLTAPRLHLCCDFEAGHAGSSGRYQQLHEIAREYAFILCILKGAEALDG